MTKDNNLNLGGVSTYETPTVKSLDVLSEGVLCGSFGDANEAGNELQETNVWDF